MHTFRTMHLFSGLGGGLLADNLLGHRPVCAVEINEHCQQVLSQRQKDGIFPWFPIFNDVTTFDGKPWRGLVHCISGGFPCQDISTAGKGEGITGERSGLWKEYARIIGEVRPPFAFMENSPMLTRRGFEVVLGDLAEMGYNAEWCVLEAAHIGARHHRARVWILAYDQGLSTELQEMVHQAGLERKSGGITRNEAPTIWASGWNAYQPSMVGTPYDNADWMERSKGIGNAQVPAVAAYAWKILLQRIAEKL